MRERVLKLKSNPLGLAVWVVIVCGTFVFSFGSRYSELYSTKERALYVIMALAFSLVTHELVHALFAALICKCRPKIKVAKDPMGIPSLCTQYPGDVSSGKRIVICIAPFILLTAVPVALLLCGTESIFLFFVAMLNSVGAYYDILECISRLIPDGDKNTNAEH